jgi:hypothetical protein
VRVFLSYDDTQRGVAERLALGLRVAGHVVFFDQDSLPAGTSYDDRIRNAILKAHLFVFLINRESVRKGAYALTELSIVEQRWPHPTGRVLPVLLDDTPIVALPPYLRAVSVLDPPGDAVGDTLNAVARLWRERRRSLLSRAAITGSAVLALGVALWVSGVLLRRDTAAANGARPGAIEATTDVNSAADDNGGMNSRVWTLKNERHVRLWTEMIDNQSNVSDNIVREAVESNAWRYNRCYDASFGHLGTALPEGEVIVGFEIRDQLPRDARVERSDFTDESINRCITGTLIGQTINAAGADGAGSIRYSFRFVPN